MKILRLTDLGYEGGGVETGIVATNEILRSHGHEVRVLSSDLRSEIAHFSDYEFRAVPSSGIKNLFHIAFNPSAYKVIKKVLKEFNPDIVFLHTMHQSTASVLFPLKKYPTVLFVHGPEVYAKTLLPWHLAKSDYKYGDYDTKAMTLVGRLHYLYFRYVCGFFYSLGLRNADQVVALSRYMQESLSKEGLSVTYIPNGVKLWPSASLPSRARIIFAAGRLESYKGIDDLIKAMPTILKTIPQAKLHIAGDGPYAEKLKELVSNLHISRSVKFLGHLRQDQIEKSYRDCAVFVMPSVWPETFGKVGIEAMSVGRPVIATDVGGVRDWLVDGDNGFLVGVHQPEEIASRVSELLVDPKKAKLMANAGRKTAKKFSMEAMVTAIESIAVSLIKKDSL